MARIRTIKPEFPQSESMGRVSRDARLCFVMLWTIADDYGRLRGNSRMLASLLFPYDDDAPSMMDLWLDDLEHEGCITRYQVDGNTYVQIEKWTQHQRVDKPTDSRIPPCDENSRTFVKPREASCQDLGPRTKDQGRDQGPSSPPRKREGQGGYPEAFENFWQAVNAEKATYQRGIGTKAEAFNEWKRAGPAKEGVDLLAAWRAYIAHCRRTETKNKDVCRWLKYRGWEDDYGPPISNSEMIHAALREKYRREDEANACEQNRDNGNGDIGSGKRVPPAEIAGQGAGSVRRIRGPDRGDDLRETVQPRSPEGGDGEVSYRVGGAAVAGRG